MYHMRIFIKTIVRQYHCSISVNVSIGYNINFVIWNRWSTDNVKRVNTIKVSMFDKWESRCKQFPD